MYKLALFPLNTVLFPGIPIQLHIFETRYRLMLRKCLEADAPFGVVLIRQGVEALGPLATPHEMGCTAYVTDLQPLGGGRMNLTALGADRFRIVELDYSQPYLTANVENVPLDNGRMLNVLRARQSLQHLLGRYLGLLAKTGEPDFDLGEMQLPDDMPGLLYLAASLLQLPASEKQPLLAAENAELLMQKLLGVYRRENALISHLIKARSEDAERSIWLN